MPTPLTIVIPLGGIGSRFSRDGYTLRCKPFVRVLGTEMLAWLVERLDAEADDAVVVVYDPAFSNLKVCLENLLPAANLKAGITLVELPGPTRGAAETVLLGLRGVPAALRARPVVLLDGDTFYSTDVVGRYRARLAETGANGVFCFSDTQPAPMYSYVTVDPSTGAVGDIREKVKISHWANSGCYCFRSGAQLAEACAALLEKNATQLSQDGKGEFYTSGVIKAMMDQGAPFQAIVLDKGDMHVLGTPDQVQDFCAAWRPQPARRFVFDLDTALCRAPRGGAYGACVPVAHTCEYLRQVKAQGHTVVVVTTRRRAEAGAATLDWLARHGVPYDELHFGKPHGHFYVDGLCVDPFQGDTALSIAKQTGFYRTDVPATRATAAERESEVDTGGRGEGDNGDDGGMAARQEAFRYGLVAGALGASVVFMAARLARRRR